MPYDGDESTLARCYDGDYAALRTPSGDVAFYVAEAVRAGGPVLELGCGTGRILVPSVQAGARMTGLDASETMLRQLRAKLPAADVHQGDMRSFDLKRRFALVTIPFRALGHVLEVAEQLAVFRNVLRHLEPEGRMVFDFFQPDPSYLVGPQAERLDVERREGDVTFRRFSTTVPHVWKQVTDVTMRWEVEGPDGAIEHHSATFPMRWYHRFELEHLLARAGFAVDALYGAFDRSPLGPDSKDLIFVARPA